MTNVYDETEKRLRVNTQNSTDNDTIRDVIGNKTDTTAGNSVVGLINVVDENVDTILVTTPRIVSKTAANLPQTTQTTYFTVTGRVLITQIVGEVTTEIQNQDCSIDLWSNPTVGADVALCTATEIKTDAVGTLYTITGTLSEALVATTSGAVTAQSNAILVTAGTIDLKTSASNTGATKWTVHYIPLDASSSVTSA